MTLATDEPLCCTGRVDQGGPDAFAGRPREEAQGEETLEPRRDLDAQKDRFLATIFHELRTPLAAARNGLFILSRAAPGGEQARRALAVIDRQLALLAKLIEDLLDVSRIRESKIRLETTCLDLADLARRSLEDHASMFAAYDLDIRAEIPGEPLCIQGDGARLAQVIGNLLQNAAKFTPRGGRVVLALEADEPARMACLRVRDTGPGFDAGLRERLFEPFQQAETTLARSGGGLGLGLSLVKGIVELHGGTVEAWSEPGKGAEFVVRLPLGPAPHRG